MLVTEPLAGIIHDAPDDAVPGDTGASSSSLDSTTVTLRQSWNQHRRRSRCFQRCITGLKLAGTYRFVTLTTSPEAQQAGLSIQRSFRSLVMRLRRRGQCSGYVKVAEFTKGGSVHLHCLVRGQYVPQWWLSETWNQIHLSPIVDVRAVRGRAGAAAYLAKYLGKDPQARLAASWDWVWKGVCIDWKATCRYGFGQGYDMAGVVRVWESVLLFYSRRPARDGPYLRGV